MKSLVGFLAVVLCLQSVRAQQTTASDYDARYTGAQAQPVKKKTLVRFDEATNEVVETPVAPHPVQAAPVAQLQPAQRQLAQYQPAAQQVQPVEEVQAPPAGSSSPIYILNNQKYQGYQGSSQNTAQHNVQEQPTTIVEGSPLRESRAEQLRKSRLDIETKTEQRIVEKLEEARIDDERARSERLFGGGFSSQQSSQSVQAVQSNSGGSANQVQIVTAPQTAQQASAPAVQVVTPSAKEDSHPSIREEVREALRERESHDEGKNRNYISGDVGMLEYPSAQNVKANGAGGFSAGTVTPDGLDAEVSFLYSSYAMSLLAGFPPFKNIDQYNVGGALKYELLSGRIRPTVGVVALGTYRRYNDVQLGYGYIPTQTATTYAMDVGLQAGLDIQLTHKLSIGGDFKYLTNVYSRQDSNYQSLYSYNTLQIGTPLEKFDYYIFAFNAKLSF